LFSGVKRKTILHVLKKERSCLVFTNCTAYRQVPQNQESPARKQKAQSSSYQHLVKPSSVRIEGKKTPRSGNRTGIRFAPTCIEQQVCENTERNNQQPGLFRAPPDNERLQSVTSSKKKSMAEIRPL